MPSRWSVSKRLSRSMTFRRTQSSAQTPTALTNTTDTLMDTSTGTPRRPPPPRAMITRTQSQLKSSTHTATGAMNQPSRRRKSASTTFPASGLSPSSQSTRSIRNYSIDSWSTCCKRRRTTFIAPRVFSASPRRATPSIFSKVCMNRSSSNRAKTSGPRVNRAFRKWFSSGAIWIERRSRLTSSRAASTQRPSTLTEVTQPLHMEPQRRL
mmetsp:Transcript_27534/g.83762  ORF Transcript_27534/g.83762 Transcript_27534/m.83762 type:complete len:210 (-) Transcript_27534:607-1236(-)